MVLLACALLAFGLSSCGSSSIDATGGSLSIGESGNYPYWLYMWDCSECVLGLSNGSTTVAVTTSEGSSGGSVYLSAGSWTGIDGVLTDEEPPSNAENDYQPCSGSPTQIGDGQWFCPVGDGEWSFVVGPPGDAAPETQPAWAAGSS